ncbi:histone deacetylase 6-like [Hibiscus syriacus]|uniref:histone deacetylase 6-like n=1 Tax=Hibiscus syriacus TaxID=106335 RepID=UPI001920612A|nr:histone deacetylase 6-like [Hibiscus syriacus]
MANQTDSSSSHMEIHLGENEYGAESGWVEAKTHCDHLASLSSDLTHIPIPSTPCNRCQHPSENWLCLSCKVVLCSRFVNKHMLEHYKQTTHCVALSYSDLSVWCFACDSYLDVQSIQQLRPVHETAYILKFGETPPLWFVESSGTEIKPPARDMPSSSRIWYGFQR